VTSLSFTRSGFFAALAAAALIAAAPDAHAARNQAAESYVQENASAALASLGNRSQSPDARQQQFGRLMGQFADVPRIANFVLGRYSTQLRNDNALRSEWQATFQDYAIAVYEDQLDRFRGNAIRVIDSVERVPGRDVIVRSQVTPRGRSQPMNVQWRILRSNENAPWKVVDVSLVLDGNEIWLAQQQQRDFLAQLDRNNGNIRALINNVRASTTEMRQRIRTRS
jgi:phospholipid transport system substrate-binding protein